jgi:translocation and assembly module TamA
MRIFFFFFCVLVSATLAAFDYTVEFQGVDDAALRNQLLEQSHLIRLRAKKPLSTYSALRKRAEQDIVPISEACQYWGYLGVAVDFTIIRGGMPKVVFKINLGPLFTFRSFSTIPEVPHINTSWLPIGKPAKSDQISQAEEKLIETLKNKGYAFCKIIKKEVVADMHDHTVECIFYLDLGKEVSFGDLTISGHKDVRSEWIRKHIVWRKGERYSRQKLEKSLQNLEKTGLFTSVYFQEGEPAEDLPINLKLQEGKFKRVSASASYTTSKGPGIGLDWQHRNINGEGNKLNFATSLWEKYQNVRTSLRQPHFVHYNQDLIWLLEFDRQDTLAYLSQAFSASSTVERRWHDRWEGFGGTKLENLHSQSPSQKSTYWLAKLPLGVKWNSTNNMFDPLNGVLFNIKLTPSYQFLPPQFVYLNHTTILALYKSFLHDRFTGAIKVVFGNIFGSCKQTIPMPDRFFAGTENTLRGYRYLSVSPLDRDRIPVGGRSLLALSFEARVRSESKLGGVLFYDVGNVYSANFPLLREGLLHSVGIGARYMTPIGPLRLDLAIPLNPRKNIDPAFQVYFSIGQAF